MADAAQTAEASAWLQRRCLDPAAKPLEIAEQLDAWESSLRREAVCSLGRRHQRALYARVEGFAPVHLAEMVPPATPALQQVRHYGRNTLPLFTRFEKRFCRPPDVDASRPRELVGHNFQTLSPVTGPGYFLAFEDPRREEVLVDYRQVPAEAPPGWPAVVSNERGLSRFVYGFMVDTLRRVSTHVTIGSAARRGRDIGSWFVLCQETPA